MPGMPFNRLPAGGPMAQQAEQEYKASLQAAQEEYDIAYQSLRNQPMTYNQFRGKVAKLNEKRKLQALRMKRDWNQRQSQIQAYEKLGSSGVMTPGQADQAQYGLSGYSVPKQERPNYWTEHRNLVQQRDRVQAEMLDPWDKRKGKWRLVKSVNRNSKSKKYLQPNDWGREATPQEIRQIEAAQGIIGDLDQYEFALLERMSPQHRKVNQLTRAMSMGPRVEATPGVGRARPRIPLGTGTPEDPFTGYADAPQETYTTPGYKMTKETAMQQAQQQLGANASRERVISLAKQIYDAGVTNAK